MDARCRIELLGQLRGIQEDRVITRFRTQKTGALLAYLAYHHHRPYPREMLADLLWPESAPEASRKSLTVAIVSLRHQLEPPGVPTGAVIQADRYNVQLNTATVTTDVNEFERALQSVAKAGSGAERVEFLQTAIELYRGPLLPGYYEDWITLERERLADTYLQAIRRLVRELAKARDLSRALDYARRAVHLDPLCEEAQRDLIRLYSAAGQPSAALRQYRELEEFLASEMQTTPSAATRRLAREIEARRREKMEAEGSPPPPSTTRRAPAASAPPSIPPPLLPPRPTGTITFLRLDVEDAGLASTQTEEISPPMPAASLKQIRETFPRSGGYEVRATADSLLVAFAGASDALEAALAIHRTFARQDDTEFLGRVGMALHTGDVGWEKGSYRGPAVQQISRMPAPHGGQILCSEATAMLLRRDLDTGVTLTDLGVYRMRGLPAPERLFQVDHTELPERAFPPLNAESGHTARLPLQFTRFFGRADEVARLTEMAQDESVRLITLTGPGGIGKTRLVLEAARQLIEPFLGAIWFVPLQDVTDSAQIPAAIVEAMRLPESSQKEPLEQVAEALTDRNALLALDNFEQLTEEGAPLVRMLLECAPTLTCLVTSRLRLNLTGEREFQVAPLPLPGGNESPEWLMRQASVQLFVDRAQAVRPDFQVTPANAGAITELCHRLEGIPLALELAAARAQVLTPAQMLEQLERRFDFLVSRQRDRALRHRTLRGALDWSYELLSPELRRFFAMLSVFRGSWTLEATEAVCAEPQAFEYLVELQESSLLFAREEAGEMRFRMLETLREYAAELLTPEERQTLWRRHAEYYVDIVERVLNDGVETKHWLDRFEADNNNFRALFDRCLTGEFPETQAGEAVPIEIGLRMAGLLATFWEVRGYTKEGLNRCLALLRHPQAGEPTLLRSGALRTAGSMAWRTGDYATAEKVSRESIEIYRSLGEESKVAASLHNLGALLSEMEQYDEARALLEEALALNRKRGVRRWESYNLASLGFNALCRKDWPAARILYEQSLAILREMNDPVGTAITLDALSEVAMRQQDFASAQAFLTEGMTLAYEVGDRRSIASLLENLAELRWTQNPTPLEGKHVVRLLAAAQALREAISTPPTPKGIAERNILLTHLRAACGQPAFDIAWAEGSALALSEAVTCALK